ncbi:hypothetical protein H9P43_002672 [Blastocladiella emersonii ATCC 22665]|nr:hypothetical protein H9P43_002672 [Blastocladiella emersonii ATCC 22665]
MNAPSTAIVPAPRAHAVAAAAVSSGPMTPAMIGAGAAAGGGRDEAVKAVGDRLGNIKSSLTSEETQQHRAAMKGRAKLLQQIEVYTTSPALQFAVLPALAVSELCPSFYRAFLAIDKVRKGALDNLLQVGVLYCKMLSIVNIVTDLRDRMTGSAADALSTHHLDLFDMKIERSASTMEKVVTELAAFAEMNVVDQTMNAGLLNRELADLDAIVEEMLADLHAHSSVASMAVQRRIARYTEETIDLANDNSQRLSRQSGRANDALKLLKVHHNAQESQLAVVRQIRAAVDNLNLGAAFLTDVNNPQVAAVWKYMLPVGSSLGMPLKEFAMALGPTLESKYADFFNARADVGARDVVELAVWRIASSEYDLFSLDDLDIVRRSSVDDDAAMVSAIQFNAAFTYEGEAMTPAPPDWLVWKYAGWAVVAESKVDALRALAADFTTGRVAADAAAQLAEVTLARLLDAWELLESPVLEYARSLAPTLQWSASGKLPKRFNPLITSLTALSKVVADALADARVAAWADDDDAEQIDGCDPAGRLLAEATKLTMQFPESLRDAQINLVEAAKRLGLVDDKAEDLTFSLDARTAAANAATVVLKTQLATLTAIDDLLMTQQDLARMQLLFDWADVTRAPGGVSVVWGDALLCGCTPVEVLQCPANRATDVISTLTLALVPLAQAAHVRRVLGFLPPTAASHGDWGIVVERVQRSVRVAEMSLLQRVQVVFDVANGLRELHLATSKVQSEMVPVGLTVARIAFTRNALDNTIAKLPVPGLGSADAAMPRVNAMQVDMFALADVVRELFLSGRGDGEDSALVAHMRELVKTIEEGKAINDEGAAPGPAQVVGALKPVLARLRASAAASVAGSSTEIIARDLERLDGIATHNATIISATETASSTFGSTDLTYDAARSLYQSAIRPLQISRSLYDHPDYDVHAVVRQLLRAGMSGHVPMALVTAADLHYFGAVPRASGADVRASASWDIAFDLYDRAASQGCEYAYAGLGDLILFQLGSRWRNQAPANDEPARLTAALALYEGAFGEVHDPRYATEYTEVQVARVYCGRADVHFALGELALARARAAAAPWTPESDTAVSAAMVEASEHHERALADYRIALARFPNCKRALARLAVFAARGLAGEPVRFQVASERLAAARSVTNRRREMEARREMFAAVGDEAARMRVEAELAAYPIPDF